MTAVKEKNQDHDGQANEEYARQVGERIVQARKEIGLTQVELAELVGSSQRAMQGYENGERVPYRQMAEIARIVNKPMAWLLHGDQAILNQDQQTALMDERLSALVQSHKELTGAVREMSKIVKRLESKIK